MFAGRHDCYAIAKLHHIKEKAAEGRLEYFLQNEPLTNEILRAHLAGEKRVGIYPLVDGYVRWFAVDFDGDTFDAAWADAVVQAEAFTEQGLFVYLERSRSGEGVHLWGFFDEPVEATIVLKALKPHLKRPDSYDRMYPVQAQVVKGGYGNLLALPFQGESLKEGNAAFLNQETREVIDPKAFLSSVQFNNRYVIEDLADRAPKLPFTSGTRSQTEEQQFDPNFEGRPERPLTGFLKLVSQFGCRFMHTAVTKPKDLSQQEWWVAVGQTTCFKNGRNAAHLLSMLDKERYNEQATDELYDRLMQHPPHGCSYIHANFPEKACGNCPLTAPYHIAKKPILELCGESKHALAKPDWKKAVARIKARNSGQEQTGIRSYTAGLDDHMRFRRAEFVVIGARPSVGKTAFMIDATINIASDRVPVFVFSGETGESGLTDRFIARVAGVDSRLLRGEGIRSLTDEEWKRINEAQQLLSDLPIYINYSTTRADQILALIEETVLENRIPLDQPYVVFQDYLQFGNPSDASDEYARVGKVSQEFKYIAAILYNNFTAFSQLRRDFEGEEAPTLDAFKSSGRIEEVADVAMVLAGDRVMGPVAPRTLWGVKQREGEVGWSIKLLLHQAICYFEPVSEQATGMEGKDMFEGEDELASLRTEAPPRKRAAR